MNSAPGPDARHEAQLVMRLVMRLGARRLLLRQLLPVVVPVALLLAAGDATGHDLRHELSQQEAQTLHLYYPDGQPFDFENYEISAPGEELPFQTGVTDALGRLAFLPDREGSWRVRVFSPDGHGLDLTIEVGADGVVRPIGPSPAERAVRLALWGALGAGALGILFRWNRRKTT